MPGTLHRLILGVFFCSSLFFISTAQGGIDSWTPLGPYGGIIQDLAVDPGDGDVVWAVSRNSGVFKTTDGGDTWVRLTNGLPDLSQSSSSFAGNCILALNTNTLLLGGGFGTTTVYKSIDGGASWTASGSGLPYDPHRFARAATGSPRPIYAATSSGIYVSRDDGATWSEDNSTLFNSNLVSVAVDPADEDIVWAGHWTGYMWGRDTNGDWNRENDSLQGVRALLMPTSSVVYAGSTAAASRGEPGIGWTWSDMNLDTDSVELEPMRGGDVDPANSAAALVGSGANIYETADTGGTWSTIFQAPLDRGLATVKYGYDSVAATYNRAYAASGLVDVNEPFFAPGILRLDTPGGAWLSAWKNQGIDAMGVNVVLQHPVSTTTLAAATSHGIFVSTDGGATWTERNGTSPNILMDADITELVLHPSDADTMYAYGLVHGIVGTADGGVTWNAESNLATVREMIMDPHNPPVLYCATDTDVVVYDPTSPSPLPSTLDILGDGSNPDVLSIAADPNHSGRLFAAAFGYGIYRTSDGGTSWQKAGSNSINATAITVNPHNSNRIYSVETDPISGYTILWRSLNGGSSWSSLYNTTEWGVVNGIAVDSLEADALYIATANAGVWVSGDGGVSWESAPGTFTGYGTNHIIADAGVTQKIYIGSATGGIYENTLTSLPVGTAARVWPMFMPAILSGSPAEEE
jgi:photosystem II stability/assembly factor-like uncharacterized protein